jgi:hypothetical protein
MEAFLSAENAVYINCIPMNMLPALHEEHAVLPLSLNVVNPAQSTGAIYADKLINGNLRCMRAWPG